MIRKYRYPILVILILLICGALYLNVKVPEKVSSPEKKPRIDVVNLMIDGKKVVGLSPGKEAAEIKTLKVSNQVSPEWKENLESSLRLQGGSDVKEVTFDKVESFIWAQEGIALNVESVIVKLKSQKGQETTFRVLVDAQSGKILKNWDQPIIDPVNPRDSFGLKVDPSYHSD